MESEGVRGVSQFHTLQGPLGDTGCHKPGRPACPTHRPILPRPHLLDPFLQ